MSNLLDIMSNVQLFAMFVMFLKSWTWKKSGWQWGWVMSWLYINYQLDAL